VLSDGTIFNSKKIRAFKRRCLYNRRQIAAKVTPSSKRKLKKLSGKEKRFSTDQNHCLSKTIANLDYGVFVIEKLTNISKSTKTKSKKANNWLSRWSFSQLEFFLEYKAAALGKSVI
jgi:putative transposase